MIVKHYTTRGGKYSIKAIKKEKYYEIKHYTHNESQACLCGIKPDEIEKDFNKEVEMCAYFGTNYSKKLIDKPF